ncbi:MAG TPA: hypothetical protein VFB14_03830 [Bryobacteraceae bacterium]|nr:hypothetical protein [Bryobacteraceae bacterium]
MVIEFALCSLVWMPLLLGAIVFGINLVRAIQVSSLSRDTGHMYAYGVDLSQQSSIIPNLGAGVGITATGGNGAILLSAITVVTPADCAALPAVSCDNLDHPVWTKMLVFGNMADVRTTLGTPDFSGVQADKEMTFPPAQYVSNTKLLVSDSLLSLFAKDDNNTGHYAPGQYAYVSEVNLISQAISWTDFSGTGSYARTIF